MRLRFWFIDQPAKLVDLGWFAYLVFLAALAILCVVNVLLLLLAYWFGVPQLLALFVARY